MTQSSLSVRMDAEIKEPLEILASDPFYSEKNQTHLNRSFQQLKEGKIVVKSIDELEKMAHA